MRRAFLAGVHRGRRLARRRTQRDAEDLIEESGEADAFRARERAAGDEDEHDVGD
jgi:hypothetical protein